MESLSTFAIDDNNDDNGGASIEKNCLEDDVETAPSLRSSDDDRRSKSMSSLMSLEEQRLASSASWTMRRSARDISSRFNSDLSFRNDLKDNKTVQELTINKLNYDAIHVIGREQETNVLISCIDRSVADKVKQLVFIKGYSGVGKSTLGWTPKKHIASLYENGIVAQGKFDLNNYEDPFAGIADVFGEICVQISTNGNHRQIGKQMAEELGSEIDLLTKLIPQLAGIMSQSESSSNDPDENKNNCNADFERLKYAFRVLTRVLCSCFAPLVLLLDDLHWADFSSLEAIDFLLSDNQNPNGLVIIGLYRSNEVDETHFLSRTITALDAKKETSRFEVTFIELESLHVSETNQIVMALLSIDDPEYTKDLAGICYRRTRGNPFFLIEFVAMLVDEGLVSFNLGLLKWVWDKEKVENETMSTPNVVDLLRSRMKKLPKQFQLLLQHAACLGSFFKLSTLELVWKKSQVATVDSSATGKIADLVNMGEEVNFIERCGEDLYRWVHDKVHEAALSLGDAGKASFQFEVGTTLYQELPAEELKDALFDVVNLINRGDVQGKAEFASLNLQAAEKARSTSAFHSAALYASNGIRLLPQNKWSAHRAMTLRLYCLGAEMELALGHDDTMEQYSKEVLSRQELSSLEKLPIYIAISHKLCDVDMQYGATIDLSKVVLKELGCPLPSASTLPFKAMHSLLRTVRAAKKKPKSSYRTPKAMTDPKLQAAMLFLSRTFYASYFTSNSFLLAFSACKMVEMTLKHGVASLSGQAYASLAMIVNAVMGDFETSSYFAETGLLIQETTRSKYTETQTLFLSSVYILAWTKPLQSCRMPLLHGHIIGMKSGNIEYAMWCANAYDYFYPYQMGKPLPSIVKSSSDRIAQMEDLRQNDQAVICRMWGQLALTLMGETQDKLVLQGDVFDPDSFDSQTKLQAILYAFLCADLYMFFGEYELAADSALARGADFVKNFNGHSLCMLETFHRGVSLYAMARKLTNSKQRHRQYSKPAKQIRKKVAKWVESGNPNVKHYYFLLCAEDSALNGKLRAAEAHYKEAIVTAARTGHLHHAGLFNERYADFLRNNLRDEDEATYRMKEAIRWYREWGASPKVEMLTKAL